MPRRLLSLKILVAFVLWAQGPCRFGCIETHITTLPTAIETDTSRFHSDTITLHHVLFLLQSEGIISFGCCRCTFNFVFGLKIFSLALFYIIFAQINSQTTQLAWIPISCSYFLFWQAEFFYFHSIWLFFISLLVKTNRYIRLNWAGIYLPG